MEKVIKIIVAVFVLAILVTIGIVSVLPKDRLTFDEEMEIRKGVQALNDDLPRQLGTIGTLDAIRYQNRAICYDMTVFGDPSIIEFYRSHYDEFRTVALYSFSTLNGQNGNANKLAEYCKAKKIGTKTTIVFADNESISWDFAPNELYDFLLSYKGTPTDAMRTVLDFNIALANYQCSNVATNSIESLSDEGIVLISLEHKDSDIIWTWSVDEHQYSIKDLSTSFQIQDAATVILGELVTDPDVQELVNLISISHSNMILRYKGYTSGKVAELYIPYSVLKHHSQVPSLH